MMRGTRIGPVLLLGCSLLSCSPATIVPPPTPAADRCVADLGAAAPQLRVALLQPVDPQRAPVPSNAGERLLFAQLYQTLVAVNCEGDAIPELAESWLMLESGRVWEFRLRADRAYRDGTTVSPHTVMQSWAARTLPIAAMNAVGERVLRVELQAPATDARMFADPAFAVARRVAGQRWPTGTSAWRIDSTAAPGMIRIASDQRVIDFARLNTTDVRAALDARMDVVIARDAATLAYARAGGAYRTLPLPWSQVYVLLGAQLAARDSAIGDSLFVLTRDAVRAAARVAQPPFGWLDSLCRDRSALAPKVAPERAVIVYPGGDAVAQGIAERLAAVAWPVSRAPGWLRALLPQDYATLGAPTAVGLDPPTFTSWLQAQRALAYVLPLPRNASADCRGADLDAGRQITPILDVRAHLIHRGNLGRVQLLGDGTIRFAGEP